MGIVKNLTKGFAAVCGAGAIMLGGVGLAERAEAGRMLDESAEAQRAGNRVDDTTAERVETLKKKGDEHLYSGFRGAACSLGLLGLMGAGRRKREAAEPDSGSKKGPAPTA